MTILHTYYRQVIMPILIIKHNINNVYDIINMEKITISTSNKAFVRDQKNLIMHLLSLEVITQQKAQITKAKQSIASFKLRKNFGIGCKVSLRNNLMYNFLYKLIYIVLPKIRGIKTFSTKQLSNTNIFSLGINNLRLFPEIEKEYNMFIENFGANIAIQFNGQNHKNIVNNRLQAISILSLFQLPFSTALLKIKQK